MNGIANCELRIANCPPAPSVSERPIRQSEFAIRNSP